MIYHLDRIDTEYGGVTLCGVRFYVPSEDSNIPTILTLSNTECTTPTVLYDLKSIADSEYTFCKTCLGIFLLEKVK